MQLSTDKDFSMFPRLEKKAPIVTDRTVINRIFSDPAFSDFEEVNVLPLIYDEKNQRCNIMIFDYERAKRTVASIVRVDSGRGRKHPIYKFSDRRGEYICEVRYGGSSANALQRGLWTHTRNGAKCFESVTNGWVDYSHNQALVKLFSHALVASGSGHVEALESVKNDIETIRKREAL